MGWSRVAIGVLVCVIGVSGFVPKAAMADCHYSDPNGCHDSLSILKPLPNCKMFPCYWHGQPEIPRAAWADANGAHPPAAPTGAFPAVYAWAYARDGSQLTPGDTLQTSNTVSSSTQPNSRTAGVLNFTVSLPASALGPVHVSVQVDQPPAAPGVSSAPLSISGGSTATSPRTVEPGRDAYFEVGFSANAAANAYPNGRSNRAERLVDRTDNTCSRLLGSSATEPQFCVVETYHGDQVEIPYTVTVDAAGGHSYKMKGGFHVFIEAQATDVPTIPWGHYQRLSPVSSQPGGETYFDDPNGVFDTGDVVYLDLDGSGTGTVADLRLTGPRSGQQVGPEDYDAAHGLKPGVLGAFCYVDQDADTAFDTSEPVYYGACLGTVAAKDIRISNPPTGVKGSRVRISDADFAHPTLPLSGARLAYDDADGNGHLGPFETVYLDADASLSVTVHDIVLSGSNAGIVVTGSGANNDPVLWLDLHDAYFDADARGSYSDVADVYLDNDASGTATVSDLRLTGSGVHSFGTLVGEADSDTTFALAATPYNAICYADNDADGAWSLGDAAYLQQSCGPMQALDLRLTAVGGKAAGSHVLLSHSDAGATTAALAASYCYDDLDSDAQYSRGDVVVIRLGGPCDSVHVGDVQIPGYVRTTAATAHFNDAIAPLAVAVGGETAFDADADLTFSADDALYLDLDASGAPTVNDVRLTGALGAGTLVRPDAVDGQYTLHDTSYNSTCRAAGSGAIYLQTHACGPNSVAALDVRFSAAGGKPAGTFVMAADADAGASTQPLATQYCYTDNASDGYALPDRLYLKLGGLCDYVAAGDIAFANWTAAPSQGSGPTPPTPTPTLFPTPGTSSSTNVPASSWTLLAAGLLGMALWRRRR